MTSLLINSGMITNIKITIHTLHCNALPYCDYNVYRFPFYIYFFSFIILPDEHIDIVNADIKI